LSIELRNKNVFNHIGYGNYKFGGQIKQVCLIILLFPTLFDFRKYIDGCQIYSLFIVKMLITTCARSIIFFLMFNKYLRNLLTMTIIFTSQDDFQKSLNDLYKTYT